MKRARRKYTQQSRGLNRSIRYDQLLIPRPSINERNGAMVLIGLGSSLGDRVLCLKKGLLWMAHDLCIDLVSTSSVWQTMPIGAAKNVFYNMCVVIYTTYSPHELIHQLLDLENRCDRLRGVHWMDRTLDLDVLLYDQQVINTPTLQVPHPRMLERSFVMHPAKEVARDWIHPDTQTELHFTLSKFDPGMWKVGCFSIAHKN